MLNNSYSWPGVATLLPVLSTATLILFCQPSTLVGKLLCHKWLVGIGLISYSLYLWHQPLFAFARIKSLAEPSAAVFTVLIVASILLAYLSWRYIEAPFRNKTRVSRRQIFQYSGIAITLCLLAGMFTIQQQGLPKRFNAPDYSASMQSSPKREQCHTEGTDYLKPANACRYFTEKVTWAVLGDSHGVELAYALAELLQQKNQGVLQLTFSGCPPAIAFTSAEPGCSAWLQEALSLIQQDDDIQHVLLTFRHSVYLFGQHNADYPALPNISPQPLFIGHNALSDTDIRQLYWDSLMYLITSLRQAGKTVFILYPVPELPVSIVKVTSPLSIFTAKTLLDTEQTVPITYYNARNKLIINKLNSLGYNEKLVAIVTDKILCTTEYCPAIKAGQALYFDDDHLSLFGANLVLTPIFTP